MSEKRMERPRVTVTLTQVLDNEFWGIDEMLEGGFLTIKNILDLIKEDYGAFIEDGELNVCIEMVKEGQEKREK